MFQSPSPHSQTQGNEWEYLNELGAMAEWLCGGDEASSSLVLATEGMDTFRGPVMVSRWIHRLTTHEIEIDGEQSPFADYLERALDGRGGRLPGSRRLLDDELVARMSLMEKLCGVPDNYRTALLLKEGHGLTVEKTADLMGVSEASIRSVLYRARQLLRAS